MVRPENQAQTRSWSVSVKSQSYWSTFKMTGLSILHDYSCVSGFVFYFNDKTNQLVGTNYGIQTPMLSFNWGSKLKLRSFADDFIFGIEICSESLDGVESCVNGGRNLGQNYEINSSDYSKITSFWGTSMTSSIGEYNCLKDFGYDYISYLA